MFFALFSLTLLKLYRRPVSFQRQHQVGQEVAETFERARSDHGDSIAEKETLYLLRLVKVPDIRQVVEVFVGSPKHSIVSYCRCVNDTVRHC